MIYLKLFLTFLKIGAFTFGGGYAMLPLIEEAVIQNRWMNMDQLVNFIAVSESTPGPFAVNVSTYVGMETGGFFGGFCATLGVVTPSFCIILIVAKCYEAFKTNKTVEGCMMGLRPAVVGLIASAVCSVGKTVFFEQGISFHVLRESSFYCSVFIFLLMIYLEKRKLHPIIIILLSGVLGILFGYLV